MELRMELKPGDRVEVESESTERPPRPGVIKEVLETTPAPRYRISWDDGHESIYTPSAGSLHPAQPAERR
jgi:translation initiation factor IF-1